MSAEESVQDIDAAQLQQQLAAGASEPQQQIVQQVPSAQTTPSISEGTTRKPKQPSVRRACVACHTGKTRCSEVLPCQSCLKRGLGATCAYPDPDAQNSNNNNNTQHDSPHSTVPSFAPPMYAAVPTTHPAAVSTPANMNHTQYYDYNGHFTGASSSSFRPAKRPRPLTDEEAQAITRNFSRGDFYVGTSAPVRIDPRLPVRLTLGEGDHVHFTVGDALV